MEILLQITQDSHSTYPTAKLSVRLEGEDVILNINDDDRDVRVNRNELARAVCLLEQAKA